MRIGKYDISRLDEHNIGMKVVKVYGKEHEKAGEEYFGSTKYFQYWEQALMWVLNQQIDGDSVKTCLDSIKQAKLEILEAVARSNIK
jgi:hypothetical protein